jgi:CubicO group peptidase (beta-lactamase class C family)
MSFRRINHLCRETMERHGIPGLGLAIVRDGRAVHLAGLGHRVLGENAPMTPRTAFHLASVTKTMTSAGVMRLVEKKQIALDDPYVLHVPGFRLDDDRVGEITIRHLMTHTAGIPDNEFLDWERPEDDDEALARHVERQAEKSLCADPGAEFYYVDIGFELLGHLIARVSGMTFEKFITRNFLLPLGMRDSTLCYRSVEEARLAGPHFKDESGETVRGDIYPYSRQHAPSSTLVSTARDLSRWMLTCLGRGQFGGKRLLGERYWRTLWKETSPTLGEFWTGVCVGYFSGEHEGHRFVGHEGSDAGFRAIMTLFPDDDLGVAVLSNIDGDHLKELMTEIFQEVF